MRMSILGRQTASLRTSCWYASSSASMAMSMVRTRLTSSLLIRSVTSRASLEELGPFYEGRCESSCGEWRGTMAALACHGLAEACRGWACRGVAAGGLSGSAGSCVPNHLERGKPEAGATAGAEVRLHDNERFAGADLGGQGGRLFRGRRAGREPDPHHGACGDAG